MRNWTKHNKPELGMSNHFSEIIGNLEMRGKIVLPNLRDTSRILVVSDYSGENTNAKYYCYSFLIMDFFEIKPLSYFLPGLLDQFDLEKRIISYKTLNDKKRFRALPSFLKLCNNINGTLFSILIDKRIKSIFSVSKPTYEGEEYQIVTSVWNKKTIEKVLRVVHILSLLVSGLARPMQDVWWFSDEDDIVQNNKSLTQITTLVGNILSHYSSINYGHLKCGIANRELNTNYLEHLCALPDLASGALVSLFTAHQHEGTTPSSDLVIPAPKSQPPKVPTIGGWLADNSKHSRLKKNTLLLHPGEGDKIIPSIIEMHNLYDYAPGLKSRIIT